MLERCWISQKTCDMFKNVSNLRWMKHGKFEDTGKDKLVNKNIKKIFFH